MSDAERGAINAYLLAVQSAAETMHLMLTDLSELHAALPLEGRFAWRPPADVMRHLIDRGPR